MQFLLAQVLTATAPHARAAVRMTMLHKQIFNLFKSCELKRAPVSPCCAPDAVQEVHSVVRKVSLHHMRDARQVEAPRCSIGAD